MCRMIAKISPEPSSIMEEMLLCPTSLSYLSQNGKQPATPWLRGKHNDGCGLAFLNQGKIEIHKRDKATAWDESYQTIIKKANSQLFIAHNRLATKGLNTSLAGAHPFFYQPNETPYAFSHNGSVASYHNEAVAKELSDSQILFHNLIDEKEKNPDISFSSIISAIAGNTSYDSLCGLLMSPDTLYAWRIYNENDSAKQEIYEAYYTLYLSMKNGRIVIASECLDTGSWLLLPNNTFISIRLRKNSLQIDYTAIEF
jgi:predicted glutamine amidotransferase